jgi:hypothetical protein
VAACSIQASSAEPSLDIGRRDPFRPGRVGERVQHEAVSRGENMASSDLTRCIASAGVRPEIVEGLAGRLVSGRPPCGGR